MKKVVLFSATALLLMTGCQPKQQMDVYKEGDVGVSSSISYGTITHVRAVQIEGKSSGVGTLLGGGVGAGAGSYVGNGSGNGWATAGAAVAGAVLGTVAENAMKDREGVEYTLALQNGDVKTIVQEKDENGDFKPGQKVMLQYCDRGEYGDKCSEGKRYQRLMPVDKFPPYVKKMRKRVTVQPGTN